MYKENKIVKLTCVALMLTMISLCLVAGTYAKYTSTASGTDATVVGKWSFLVNGTEIATKESSTINFGLFDTILDEDGNAETDVASGLIAPGTKGAFEFELENTSDVTAQYQIDFEITNENNIPIEFSTDGTNWDNDLVVEPSEDTVLAIGSGAKTQTIMWKWSYDGDDSIDTSLGSMETSPTITVSATVTATQYAPLKHPVIAIKRDITSTSQNLSVIDLLTQEEINNSDYKFLSDIENVTLTTGDEMVKFTKFYYGRKVENNQDIIYLSDYETKNTPYVHPAFIRYDEYDNELEMDYIYVAANESGEENSTIYSKSALTPKTGYTLDTWRTKVTSKGYGWQLMDEQVYSMVQMLAMADNATINLGNSSYFGLNKITGSYWDFLDGSYISSGVYYYQTNPNKYANYDNYENYGNVVTSGTWLKDVTFDNSAPWIMMPKESGGSASTYFGSKLFINGAGRQTVTVGGMGSNNEEDRLFAYVYNDGKMTEGGSGYYASRMVYVPFDSQYEPVVASTWKDAFGYTESSGKATGFKEYTDSTTYTYKFINSSNEVVVGDTVTEENTLRYWLHVPFNYKSTANYPLIVYLHGSGGAIYLQQSEHGSEASTKSYKEYQNTGSRAMQMLGAPNSQGNTIKSIMYDDGTIKSTEAFGGSWDSNFVSSWFDKVKADQSNDAFFIFVQLNDELWFENRATYTINGQSMKALDINSAYLAGEEYGSVLPTSKGTYNHSYISSKQSPNVWFQLLVSLQDKLIKEYSIDKNRQYVVGASLGGVGTYDLISHYPNRYAAAVSVAAPGADVSASNVNNLINTKVLAYHGTSDGWVSSASSEAFVSALNNAGGTAEYKTFSGGHDSSILKTQIDYVMNFLYSNHR